MSETNNIENILKMGLNQDDPNYDKIMDSFKVSCPVKKININLETPGCIAGMWLISTKEGIDYLKDNTDLNDLQDNTFLFFTNQHIVEMTNVLNGILFLLEEAKKEPPITTREKRLEVIQNFVFILSKPMTYKLFISEMKKVSSSVLTGSWFDCQDIIKKIDDILQLLPFISYKTIDDIAKMGIDEFNNGDGNGK